MSSHQKKKKSKSRSNKLIPSYRLSSKVVYDDQFDSLRKKIVDEGKHPTPYTFIDTQFENLDCDSDAGSGKFTGSTSVEVREGYQYLNHFAKIYPGYRRSSGSFVSNKFRIDGEWEHCHPGFGTILYVDGSSYTGSFDNGCEGIADKTANTANTASITNVADNALATAITLNFPKHLTPFKLKDSKLEKSDELQMGLQMSGDSTKFSGNIVGPLPNKYRRMLLCSGTLAWASKLTLGIGHQCLLPLPLLPVALTDLVTEYQEHFALRFSNTVGHPPTLSIHQGSTDK